MYIHEPHLKMVPDCRRMLYFCAFSLGQKSMKPSEFPNTVYVAPDISWLFFQVSKLVGQSHVLLLTLSLEDD